MIRLLGLAVLVSFSALCAAQERPVIPNTFRSDTENMLVYLTKNGEEYLEGNGMISQWQEKNKAIQEESLASTRGSAETIEMYFMHLYRFDMGLEFHYRRESDNPYSRCEKTQVYGDMFPYFDWVQQAKYYERRIMGETEYDFWRIEVGADVHEIGVAPTNVNVPVYYIHHHEYANRTIYRKFMNFVTEPMEDAAYDIPAYCNM